MREGCKETEIGVIPEDWEIKSIGSYNPYVTSGSRGWAKYYSESGSLFLRIINMVRDSIYPNLKDSQFVFLPEDEKEGKRTQLQNGDVLISITADIGIISYIGDDIPKPAYINQHIALVRFENILDSRFISYFLACSNAQKHFISLTDNGAKAGMSLIRVNKILLALPPTKAEQTAIATALSDMDNLINGLEQLIEKKKAIKQGAMQQLLKPKEGWVVKKLGDVAEIYTGKKNNQDKVENGQYPFFVRSQSVERINTYSFDGEAILIPGEGNIGKIFHFINGKFDFHQRVYKISDFKEGYLGKYIYRYISEFFGRHALGNSVKATVDSLRLPTFEVFEIPFPKSLEEQTTIATILSDIDSEISSLENNLSKYKMMKQGMMQELLTGKTRLI